MLYKTLADDLSKICSEAIEKYDLVFEYSDTVYSMYSNKTHKIDIMRLIDNRYEIMINGKSFMNIPEFDLNETLINLIK